MAMSRGTVFGREMCSEIFSTTQLAKVMIMTYFLLLGNHHTEDSAQVADQTTLPAGHAWAGHGAGHGEVLPGQAATEEAED